MLPPCQPRQAICYPPRNLRRASSSPGTRHTVRISMGTTSGGCSLRSWTLEEQDHGHATRPPSLPTSPGEAWDPTCTACPSRPVGETRVSAMGLPAPRSQLHPALLWMAHAGPRSCPVPPAYGDTQRSSAGSSGLWMSNRAQPGPDLSPHILRSPESCRVGVVPPRPASRASYSLCLCLGPLPALDPTRSTRPREDLRRPLSLKARLEHFTRDFFRADLGFPKHVSPAPNIKNCAWR